MFCGMMAIWDLDALLATLPTWLIVAKIVILDGNPAVRADVSDIVLVPREEAKAEAGFAGGRICA